MYLFKQLNGLYRYPYSDYQLLGFHSMSLIQDDVWNIFVYAIQSLYYTAPFKIFYEHMMSNSCYVSVHTCILDTDTYTQRLSPFSVGCKCPYFPRSSHLEKGHHKDSQVAIKNKALAKRKEQTMN